VSQPSLCNWWVAWVRSAIVVATLWLLGLLHRMAFRLDMVLFRSLQDTPIRDPLFVFGLPRSGTTLMHRLLATGEHFTTPPLWEVLFAPALCQKYFFYVAYRVDQRLGGPGRRALQWVESWGSHQGSAVHATSLQTPEEDFLALLPFGGCFLTVLVWPRSERIWRLGYFRGHLPEEERQRLLKIYRGLVTRHVRFRGGDKCYLSKNPSFTGWATDLQQEFPHARFIGLRRDPAVVVASQLSSLEPGLAFFGSRIDHEISHRFVKMLAWYWHLLNDYGDLFGEDRFQLVEYSDLTADQFTCVTQSLTQLGYPLSPAFRESLSKAAQTASRYQSLHRYSLEQYHLNTAEVMAAFQPTQLA
jgi:omega-hydroxy-beta-dihydromenaquinone-9 sulfotransferase